MPELEAFATVVRSPIHDRTWVAHIAEAGFDNTPAGPLLVVKAEVLDQAEGSGFEVTRWRQADVDTWVLDVG